MVSWNIQAIIYVNLSIYENTQFVWFSHKSVDSFQGDCHFGPGCLFPCRCKDTAMCDSKRGCPASATCDAVPYQDLTDETERYSGDHCQYGQFVVTQVAPMQWSRIIIKFKCCLFCMWLAAKFGASFVYRQTTRQCVVLVGAKQLWYLFASLHTEWTISAP